MKWYADFTHQPTFSEGQCVRLRRDAWERPLAGRAGRVASLEWRGVSWGAPDGYFYRVTLDDEDITIQANSDGLELAEVAP